MKRLSYAMALLILMFGFLSSKSSLAFQNEPEGFRDVKWGTNANSVEGLVYMPVFDDHERGLKTYISKRDKPFIDDIPIKEINYVADMADDKIISAGFSFSCTDYKSIKNKLFSKYGRGKTQQYQTTWKGEKTIIELLNFNPGLNHCSLTYKATTTADKFIPPSEKKGNKKKTPSDDL